jgi:hypothetical protein
MNKYGLTAIKSVQKFRNNYSIVEVWSNSAKEIFATKSSQEKGCPKGTFLGLCEEGLVKRIPKANYTKSVTKKEYALKAIEILKWAELNLGEKRSNSQMDFVLALLYHYSKKFELDFYIGMKLLNSE